MSRRDPSRGSSKEEVLAGTIDNIVGADKCSMQTEVAGQYGMGRTTEEGDGTPKAAALGGRWETAAT